MDANTKLKEEAERVRSAIDAFLKAEKLPKETPYVTTAGTSLFLHGLKGRTAGDDVDIYLPDMRKPHVEREVSVGKDKITVEAYNSWMGYGPTLLSKRQKKHGVWVSDLETEADYKSKLDKPKHQRDATMIKEHLKKAATKDKSKSSYVQIPFKPGYVRVKIKDSQGNHLQHHFVRVNRWGLPAGGIEKGETPRQAAARELLERTGYKIDETALRPAGRDSKGFYIFEGDKKDTKVVAKPGQLGGYSTKVKWGKDPVVVSGTKNKKQGIAVKAHTRKLRNGKSVRIKAHTRKTEKIATASAQKRKHGASRAIMESKVKEIADKIKGPELKVNQVLGNKQLSPEAKRKILAALRKKGSQEKKAMLGNSPFTQMMNRNTGLLGYNKGGPIKEDGYLTDKKGKPYARVHKGEHVVPPSKTESAIIKALKKEGGAAGMAAIKKHVDSEDLMAAMKSLMDKNVIFKHKHGDIILREKTAAVATKTDPALWEQSKRDAKASMGGKHSARAMQRAVAIYKQKGGGYSGKKPTTKNNSLKKWTSQKWQWSRDSKEKKAGKGVYLPKEKIERLKSSKKGRNKLRAAEAAKSKATREGYQYSSHGLAAGTSLKEKKAMHLRLKSHDYYDDDSKMLCKVLEGIAAQAMELRKKIKMGTTLPSWAEYKVYKAGDSMKSALGASFKLSDTPTMLNSARPLLLSTRIGVEKHASREMAALGGSLGGLPGTFGAALGADEDKKGRAAVGQFVGNALGAGLGGGAAALAMSGKKASALPLLFIPAGSMVGGGLGAYIGHGKNTTNKEKIKKLERKLARAKSNEK